MADLERLPFSLQEVVLLMRMTLTNLVSRPQDCIKRELKYWDCDHGILISCLDIDYYLARSISWLFILFKSEDKSNQDLQNLRMYVCGRHLEDKRLATLYLAFDKAKDTAIKTSLDKFAESLPNLLHSFIAGWRPADPKVVKPIVKGLGNLYFKDYDDSYIFQDSSHIIFDHILHLTKVKQQIDVGAEIEPKDGRISFLDSGMYMWADDAALQYLGIEVVGRLQDDKTTLQRERDLQSLRQSLILALEKGDMPRVEELVRSDSKLQVIAAAYSGDIREVEILLDKGADILDAWYGVLVNMHNKNNQVYDFLSYSNTLSNVYHRAVNEEDGIFLTMVEPDNNLRLEVSAGIHRAMINKDVEHIDFLEGLLIARDLEKIYFLGSDE